MRDLRQALIDRMHDWDWKGYTQLLECEKAEFADEILKTVKANLDYEAAWAEWFQHNSWWKRMLMPRTPIKHMVDAALTGDTE